MTRRLVLVIDQERCIGCDTCTVACNRENNPKAGPWIRVETRGARIKDTPVGRFPDLKMEFLPRLCMHCTHPPCVDVCPTGALVKQDNGPVVIEEDKCDACLACPDACPYDAIHFNEEKGVVEKCHLCIHRIEEGLEPFCAICCEGQAIHFGDLTDPESNVSRLIRDREPYQLNPELKTGPSVYYCPPRKRRRLV